MQNENKQSDFENMIKDRTKRAKDYDERNGTQQKWYSSKASDNKNTFRYIGIAIIVLGALVSVTSIVVSFLSGESSVPSLSDFLVSLFGALIVILKGIERIWLPEETWQNYRKASEALKRENECYVEGVNNYKHIDNEDEAFKLFVTRCILIKAEEQNNFWGLNEEKVPITKSEEI